MRESQQLVQDLERTLQALEQQREQELPGVIAQVRELIRDYGLTAADCGFAEAAIAQRSRAIRRRTVEPKYRNPYTGELWTGRGKQPVWFREALARGTSRESLQITH